MAKLGIGAVVVIIGLFVIFQMFPSFMDATHDVITDETSVSGNVTTGAAETTGTVGLTFGLYQDEITNVVSITSTEGSDTPAASSYAAASDLLTVSGLAANSTRILTVTYDWDATTQFEGFGPITRMAPLLMILAVIGIAVFSMYKGKAF